MTPALLHALLAARREGASVVLATRLDDGRQVLLPDASAPVSLRDAADRALQRDESCAADLDGETWFMHVHASPYRLLVVGAVHVGQGLTQLAASLSFSVTVIDPRRTFASAERFPGVTLSHLWPDEAIEALAPDARTAIVTLTHDPKLDDPAIDRALRSNAFFIGALGSRRTHAARLERLALLGHAPAALARVRGPVGLALGSVTAQEIALSIVAEIVAVRRGAALAVR